MQNESVADLSLGEDLFHQVFESAPNAMIIVDQDGTIVLVNVQCERQFGYQRHELQGEPVETLVPERFRKHHPAFRVDFSLSPQTRSMGGGRDLFGRRKDDSEFAVEIGLNPISTSRGPMTLAAIVDITERKRLEERFRRVVEYAPGAMIMVNHQGKIILANAQTENLFGYDRQTLLTFSVEQLVPERFRDHHPAYRQGFVAMPQPRPMGVGRDLHARRSDGSEFPVEIGLNPIDTDEGPMVLVAILDITERQRIQQNLEGALREKTVLLNEVHHRVKNNLQVVSSLLSLQSRHIHDGAARASLDECRNRVSAMALTHQLLYERSDFSRVDLGEYIDRLTQLLLGVFRVNENRVALRLDFQKETVFLDLERAVPCGLIVNELMVNAFKHGFPDGRNGTIRVTLSGDEDSICLGVSDTGIGLPLGFDLQQVQSLGLQLVPLLVEQIQGELTISTSPVTSFDLCFPTQSRKDKKK